MPPKKGKDAAKAAKKAIEAAHAEWEVERKRNVDRARFASDGVTPRDILAEVPAFCSFNRGGIDCTLTFAAPGTPAWTPELATFIFDLTKANMQPYYDEAPGWGWKDVKKRLELCDDDMRYIIARSTTGAPLAFVGLRFEVGHEGELAYIYELQLTEAVQRKGLGRHIMSTVELAARKAGMMWVKLTVLKNNRPAVDFYTSKMKYTLAGDDPSHDGEELAHLILCKCVDKAGANAAQERLDRINRGELAASTAVAATGDAAAGAPKATA